MPSATPSPISHAVRSPATALMSAATARETGFKSQAPNDTGPSRSGQSSSRTQSTPSGTALHVLFPRTALSERPSRFGNIARRPSRHMQPTACGAVSVCDPAMAASEVDVQKLREAFSELSPDDRVLRARTGTRLVS